jgi:murein DD-endopeptidase MepM/ murein hydrolase activator NlpD
MVTENRSSGSRVFPEIRICFFGKAPVLLPRWTSAAVLLAMVAGGAGVRHLAAESIAERRLVADAQAALARAQTANAELRGDVAGLGDRLASVARQRQAVEADASFEDGRLAELARALAGSRQALDREQAKSTTLTARLGKTEADRAAAAAQFARYQANLSQMVDDLRRLGAARGIAGYLRARLQVQLEALGRALAQAPPPVTAAAQSGAPDATIAAAPDLGYRQIAQFERALGSAGVDVARLFAQLGHVPAEGGPFVPPPKANAPVNTFDPEKLAAIRGLAKVLPIAAPLAQYRIGSPFGPRLDPFNGKDAFHTGIDMDAPYNSPVYATAPGTVIYAGYLGEYGKTVEIDHGFGIDTLYAHLHSYFVAVGQEVAAQAEIGLVGTTGRSTGPHVHYEVRVNGQPQDPEKFIELSWLIPVAAEEPSPQLSPAAAGSAGNSR